MPSLRKSVNDKCKECIYDPLTKGTWRKQVEECTSYACPLYTVRPVPVKQYSGEEDVDEGDRLPA